MSFFCKGITKDLVLCKACQIAKSHKLPFCLHTIEYLSPLNLYILIFGPLQSFLIIVASIVCLLLMILVGLFGFFHYKQRGNALAFSYHLQR